MIKGTKEILIIFVLIFAIGITTGIIFMKSCNKPKEQPKIKTDEKIKARIDSSDNDELRSIIDSTIAD